MRRQTRNVAAVEYDMCFEHKERVSVTHYRVQAWPDMPGDGGESDARAFCRNTMALLKAA